MFPVFFHSFPVFSMYFLCSFCLS